MEQLILGLRVIHVIEYMANGEVVNSGSKLEKLFTATPLLPKLIVNLQRPELIDSSRDPAQDLTAKKRIEQYVRLWDEYATTYDALEEVKRLRTEVRVTSAGMEGEASEPSRIPDMPASSSDVASLASEDESLRQGSTSTVQVTPLRTVSFESRPFVLEQEFQTLSEPTRSLLQNMRIDRQNIDLPPLVNDLQEKLSNLTTIIHSIDDRGLIDVMPEKALRIPGIMALREAIKSPLPIVFPKAAPVAAPVKVLGIGDLKVVKQTLEKYVAGEVAHIENVLKGESKERKHRIFDRTEEIITIAQETTEETERDTQTTDRFELKKESERTIQSDMSIDAGVTVSASYGPVELGAYANFAYSTSSKETTKNASNFARDVVDRSVTRIQKKVREERITKTIHEVEEINTHGLDNKGGTEHITGIYRWVDKHYKAQLYNYGKRLMLEFIVPEPAAFWEYAQTNQPKKEITPPVPLENLTHKDIHDWNYQTYIRAYNVQGCTPPPPFSKIASVVFDQSGIQDGQTSSKSTKELVVPEGYVGKYIGVGMSVVWENYPHPRYSMYRRGRRGLIGYLEEQFKYVAEELSKLEADWKSKRHLAKTHPDRHNILIQFGKLLHAVEDYFFHSNYVEIHLWNSLQRTRSSNESEDAFKQWFAKNALMPYRNYQGYKSYGLGATDADPDAGDHIRWRRKLMRRLRYPIYNPELVITSQGTEKQKNVLSQQTSEPSQALVYTGGFENKDMFHTMASALENLESLFIKLDNATEWLSSNLRTDLNIPSTQALRNSELVLIKTLFNTDERTKLADNEDYLDRRTQLHIEQIHSGVYDRGIEKLFTAGYLNQSAKDALLEAFAIDKRLEDSNSRTPGVGGFLIAFLAEAQDEVNKSRRATERLDRKNTGQPNEGDILNEATDNGSSAEIIGTHTLMAKDTPKSQPLYEDAKVLAKFASLSVVTLMLTEIDRSTDATTGLDWSQILEQVVRFGANAGLHSFLSISPTQIRSESDDYCRRDRYMLRSGKLRRI